VLVQRSHFNGVAWSQVRVPTSLESTQFEGISVRPGLVLLTNSDVNGVNAIVRTGAW